MITTETDISKARAIEGFMQESELLWLAQQAQTHQRIAEIGAYYGRSTRALADNAQGTVHTFDDFWGPRDLPMDWRKRHLVLDTFRKNLGDHIESGRLVVHEENHAEVKPEGLYDMIFIDGSHEYWDFRRDLDIWLPHLAPQGLLCGHDYDLSYPGILRALAEVIPPTKKLDRPDNTAIWAVIGD